MIRHTRKASFALSFQRIQAMFPTRWQKKQYAVKAEQRLKMKLARSVA